MFKYHVLLIMRLKTELKSTLSKLWLKILSSALLTAPWTYKYEVNM